MELIFTGFRLICLCRRITGALQHSGSLVTDLRWSSPAQKRAQWHLSCIIVLGLLPGPFEYTTVVMSLVIYLLYMCLCGRTKDETRLGQYFPRRDVLGPRISERRLSNSATLGTKFKFIGVLPFTLSFTYSPNPVAETVNERT
jgi:hypothetical protein